jgi:hypothetical protein
MSEFSKLADDLNAADAERMKKKAADAALIKAHGIVSQAIGKASARDICRADFLLRRAASRLRQ